MNELEMPKIDVVGEFTPNGCDRMESGMEISRLTPMLQTGKDVRNLI
jgi:hypothetical protein